MAKIVLTEQEKILTFPVDTILDLLIEETVIKTVPSQRGDWQKLEVKFKILGIQALGGGGLVESTDPADYENWITQNIFGSVPFKLTDHPENKLRMWCEAIFRQELGPGFELDTDMFHRRKVRGLTGQYDARATDSQGNPFKRHDVTHLLPGGDGAAAAAAPPVAAAADPWGTPGQPAAQPAGQPAGAAPAVADPWAGADPWANTGDEPPF
jgi:hypothetical protein